MQLEVRIFTEGLLNIIFPRDGWYFLGEITNSDCFSEFCVRPPNRFRLVTLCYLPQLFLHCNNSLDIFLDLRCVIPKRGDETCKELPVLDEVLLIASLDSMRDGDGDEIDRVSRGEFILLLRNRVDEGSEEEVCSELVPTSLVRLLLPTSFIRPLSLHLFQVEGGEKVEVLEDGCREVPPGPTLLSEPRYGPIIPPSFWHCSREGCFVDKPLGVLEELRVDASVFRRFLFCAFAIAFKTVEKHLLRRSFRLIDLYAAGEELADVLETFWWVSYQAFEVIDPSSSYRWLLTSSLGAA